EPARFEAIHISADGREHVVDFSINPIYDENGKLRCLLAESRDITGSKQKESQLLEAYNKLDKLISLNRDGIIVVDKEGVILFINPAGADMLGRSADELVGMEFGWPVTAQESAEIELLPFDGLPRVSEIYAAETQWEGKPAYLLSLRDVTERRQAEEALKQSEEKYRTVLENMEEGYFEVDLAGNYTFYNAAMRNILGYPDEELKGVNYKHYMNEQTAEKIYKDYNWVYRTGKPYKALDIELIRKDGSVCYVDASIYLRRDSEINPIGFKGMVRDVTERKQAEQEREKLEAQLRQSQKMEAIGTLAGGIAHDFNNILSSVIGYTELSLDEAEKDSTLHRNLSQVLSAGNRAKDLVRQILALSRQEEQEVKPAPVIPLVKEALKMLRSTIPSSIEVRENIRSDQLIVNADPTQLHQVIVNLATNARQAMAEESGVLEVAVESVSFDKESISKKYVDMRPGNYVRITVSDTGGGISEQYLDKIFEPYFTTKEKGTGTGLGLSIVHGIVKRHSGHISVYSEPGRGTVFHVYLPLAAQGAESAPVQKEGTLPAGTESILLVDDEQPIVEMQQMMLESLGYRVASRTSAVEALEAFRSNPDKFDILITDMAMPNMSGDKLAVAVKEIRPDIPVILCTGFSQKLNVFKDSPAIEHVLMKPVGKAEIAKAVRKILDGVKKQEND
ncbi:MAG: PAS domain S-box protein, partial [Desulfobacterales bacterium]|nr:PAS domain S-box protein [Desulfobacterales bacterium]